MTTTITKPSDLLNMVGSELGTSTWRDLPQADIDKFADATGDHQWIHVDADRAKDGPFGTTIAHGYMTLALVIPMWTEVLLIEELGMAVNYGLNKVRFPAPVPSGSRLRLAARLAACEEVAGGGVQATVDAVVEGEGIDKPVCIAQIVHRYYAS